MSASRDDQPLRLGRPLPRPPWRRHGGLIRRMMVDPRPVLDDLRREFGPVVGLGAGPMRLAVVGDPFAIHQLFTTEVEAFRWGHRFNVLGFVVGRTSLIVSDGPDWRRRRSALRSGFTRRRLNGWIDEIVRLTDRRIEAILARLGDSTATLDLYHEGRELVQEIVVRTMFGDALAQRAPEIAALFQRAQEYLEAPSYRQLPHPFRLGRRARVRSDLDALRSIVDQRIAQVRAHPDDDPLDVIATLVNDGELSDEEIRDQVLTLMGAGMDTTSATLAWILWCVTLADAQLWHRLRAEADMVLGTSTTVDAHHLAHLDLASRVVREAARLHPAGSFAPRMAHRDVDVGGYRIPKGTLVLWSAHLAGRDPLAWDRPLEFDPDRFVDPTPDQAARAAAAWVPFGGGQRNCIGFALAQLELTLILARMAQRLEVEAVDRAMPEAVGLVVNHPAGGAVMRVSARRRG